MPVDAAGPRHFVASHGELGTWVLLLGALCVRIGFVAIYGVHLGGDSQTYLSWAEAFANGNPGQITQWTFHILFPLALAPAYLLGLPAVPYAIGLQVVLSTATVWFVRATGRLLFGPRLGWAVGIIAAIYPTFLFWMVYVLSDTTFVFCLAVFLWVFVNKLREKDLRWRLVFVGSSLVLLIARPTSLAVLFVSSAMVLLLWFKTALGWRKGLTGWACCVAGFLLLAAALLSWPPIRLRLLNMPVVVQSLWLSTRVTTSDIDEYFRMVDPPLPANTPYDQIETYKVNYAITFISREPVRYLAMASRRFTSFWYPWLFARWSLPHRIWDMTLSIALTLGSAACLFNRSTRRQGIIALLLVGLSLALLSSFSQVDSDARYRVPAELTLLIIAPGGLAVLTTSGLGFVRRLLGGLDPARRRSGSG